METIFRRTSVRRYKDTPVETEKIEYLLRAAMAAPSAGNQQPWEFYVVRDRKLLAALAESSPYAGCTKAAPVAIVPCYSRARLQMPEYAEIDLSAAVENMLLAAEASGLGAVWLGIAPVEDRMKQVRTILDLPTGMDPFAIVPVGYPEHKGAAPDRFDAARIHFKNGK